MHAYTHIHIVSGSKAAILFERLLLQGFIHKSLHTCVFQAHTISDWILLSSELYISVKY